MKPETAAEVTAMMEVVEEGTGTAAASQGIEVAGKTGTAEIDDRRHQPAVVHRLRAGARTRSVAIAVTVERVAPGFGGTVAAPIAKHVHAGAARTMTERLGRRARSSTAATGCSRASGPGGMADVFCAEDLQLGRKVALKLLHRRFAEDHEFVERFRREASRAAGLQHPNVVGVYDRGEYDGTYYIAMEYLEGRTLKRHRARRRRWTPTARST